MNQEITIHGTDGSKVKAFADGIDEHGRLIAAFPNGETKTVDAAGCVRPNGRTHSRINQYGKQNDTKDRIYA